jgi:hypothetical protein
VGLWQTIENYWLKNVVELDNTWSCREGARGERAGGDFKERAAGSAWAERE